jgi:hypothetical protein
MTHTTRRELAMLATAALIARTALAQTNEAPSIIRAIPRTGERIPAVGLGTAYGFDRDDEQTRRAATRWGSSQMQFFGCTTTTWEKLKCSSLQ